MKLITRKRSYKNITVYEKRHFESTGSLGKLAFKVDSSLKNFKQIGKLLYLVSKFLNYFSKK